MMLTCVTVHGVENPFNIFSWNQGLSEMMDGSKIWMSLSRVSGLLSESN